MEILVFFKVSVGLNIMSHASALPYSTQTPPSLNQTRIMVSHDRPKDKTWACIKIKNAVGDLGDVSQGKVLAIQVRCLGSTLRAYVEATRQNAKRFSSDLVGKWHVYPHAHIHINT